MRLIPLLSLALCLAPFAPTSLARAAGDGLALLAQSEGREEPRWEFGLGALQLNGRDYPGSARANQRLFVLPYVVYRGEKLRIGDGQGVRALAFENSRFSLDLSLAAAVNADSADNPLRDGLPDIDYLFELGPQLMFTGFDRANPDGSHSELTAAIQLRGAFSTDLRSIDSAGAVASLFLEYNRRDLGPGGRFAIYARGGPKWASEALQDIFYEVEPQYARADRPAYDARGGYLGTEIGVGGRWTARPNLWLYAGLGKQFYGASANADSPLIEIDSADTWWLGMLWEIAVSDSTIRIYR